MLRSTRFGVSIAGLTALLITAGSANALSVSLSASPFTWGDGGEFIATPNGFPSTPVSLTNDGKYQTFCYQSQVHITLGTDYDSYFTINGVPGGPQLTEQVAFLYSQFILKQLPNYDYSNALSHHQVDAGALQYAIWNLTGQSTAGLMFNPEPTKTTDWITYAQANAQAGNFYGVEVVVSYTGALTAPHYVQSQLVKFLPAPGSGALALLGGVMAFRRRRPQA